MDNIEKSIPLRGFFAIWVEGYDPEGGSFRLSPHGSKAYEGWAVSKSRYCSRDNWKAIRRFVSWEEVVAYMDAKTKNGKCPFEPVYVLESKNSKYICPVTSREEAVEVDVAERARELEREAFRKRNLEILRQTKRSKSH